MKKFILISALFLSFYCNSQNNKDSLMGKTQAEKELDFALSNQKQHNVLDNVGNLLKDSASAIKVAETILFGIYGKEKIEGEKPYETYLIKNYWVIQGSLPMGSKGGTFIIILNAKNSAVLKISHGK